MGPHTRDPQSHRSSKTFELAVLAALASASNWGKRSRQSANLLQHSFTCQFPEGDCSKALLSPRHLPFQVNMSQRFGHGVNNHLCVGQSPSKEPNALDMDWDVRCLPDPWKSLTCRTIGKTLQKGGSWPNGLALENGKFNPFADCAVDPGMVVASCSFQCNNKKKNQHHGEVTCRLKVGQHFNWTAKQVRVKGCQFQARCLDATTRNLSIVCSGQNETMIAEIIRKRSFRTWVVISVVAVVVLICASACYARNRFQKEGKGYVFQAVRNENDMHNIGTPGAPQSPQPQTLGFPQSPPPRPLAIRHSAEPQE